MTVTIINQSGRAIPRRYLVQWIKSLDRLAAREVGRVLASERPRAKRRAMVDYKKKELVVVFLSAKEARHLNKTYRDRDYATDVLSFGSTDAEVLGELVICPEVIARQAREHGLLVREELGYMVLHGFLHLLGFDHERSKAEERRMFALQDRLFDRLLSLVR